jgi:hypothetical protein
MIEERSKIVLDVAIDVHHRLLSWGVTMIIAEIAREVWNLPQ